AYSIDGNPARPADHGGYPNRTGLQPGPDPDAGSRPPRHRDRRRIPVAASRARHADPAGSWLHGVRDLTRHDPRLEPDAGDIDDGGHGRPVDRPPGPGARDPERHRSARAGGGHPPALAWPPWPPARRRKGQRSRRDDLPACRWRHADRGHPRDQRGSSHNRSGTGDGIRSPRWVRADRSRVRDGAAAESPRARGAGAGGVRSSEQGNRADTWHQRSHGEVPCQLGIDEAGRRKPHRGRYDRQPHGRPLVV
ncbi:MAG: hypothetical protein AVDCRST_MAG43-1716, partial [uncultured Thermomicrobiales bacterium]